MAERKHTEQSRSKFRLWSLKNHKLHLEAQAKKVSSPDPVHLRYEIDTLTNQIAVLSKQLQRPSKLHRH